MASTEARAGGTATSTEDPEVPRRRRAASLAPDERRSMIMDAALPLLLARGEEVTSSEIARAAGIAEGTIFRVFANKDELIDTVLKRALDPEPVEEAIGAIDTGAGLEAVVTEVVQIFQRRMADAWQLISNLGPRFHKLEPRRRIDSPALTRLLESFRSELDVDPAEAAQVLPSVTFALTHPVVSRQPSPPERVARVYLHGVGKPGKPRC
jgi:AcrR family transcriptional regulator